jgi:parvulin-like peptidyl-prolyl isomerase
MRAVVGICVVCLVIAASLAAFSPARAEVIEEIVAVINGDIITKSDFEEEERMMVADTYRRLTGDELDQQVQEIRDSLLMQMIDRKILVHRAEMLYDTEKMGEVFLDSFKKQQNITDDEELERALAREGMTVEHLKTRLIEMFAPDEVVRHEVGSRIAIGDKEVEAYYTENPDAFRVPAEATLREIVLLAESEERKEERRAEAVALRERAAAAEDFAALASELSESGTKENGGLLGPVGRGELAMEIDALVFSLPVGEVSKLFETEHGFHIIMVETRRDEGLAPIDEVREGIRRFLEERKYVSELAAFMEEARKEASWCVKPKYVNRLPEGAANNPCAEL